jgi:Zn-dependent peptidase ImmA (M78 family)
MVDLNAAIYKVLEEYQKQTDLAVVPVEVGLVQQSVCAYSAVDNIVIKAFNLKTVHILGQVQFWRRADGPPYAETKLEAEIHVSSTLNDCWRRFVCCKEIMHCVLDQKDQTHIGNINDLKALAETLVNRSIAAIDTVRGFDTEMAAEVMAIEVLFPLELREAHVESYRAGLLTDLQLAMRYKIPEQIVRSAMAPHYIETIQRLRTRRIEIG